MNSVRAAIHVEHRTEALVGGEAFCKQHCDHIVVAPVDMVSGNKTHFRRADHLVHFLFDFDDGRTRTHWESRPYRKSYQRAVTGIAQRLEGRQYGQWFSQDLHRRLLARHCLLPYPCVEVLLQTTKAGERMWSSVVHASNKPDGGDRDA